MIATTLMGLSPMPKPIPAAVVSGLFGELPRSLLMTLAVGSHLAYGGVWGGIFAAAIRKVTVGRGLRLGILLWLLMNLVVLPLIGWGLFGMRLTGAIGVATLVLHLIYGGTYGWLMDRAEPQVEGRVRRAA